MKIPFSKYQTCLFLTIISAVTQLSVVTQNLIYSQKKIAGELSDRMIRNREVVGLCGLDSDWKSLSLKKYRYFFGLYKIIFVPKLETLSSFVVKIIFSLYITLVYL